MNKKLDDLFKLLWKRSRFTSYFFQHVQFSDLKKIPTISLSIYNNRFTLFYNENFIQKLNIEEILGLLIHEMFHVILNHEHRGYKNEDIYLRNLSQDMVINSFLIDRKKTFFSKKKSYSADIPDLILPRGLPVIPREFFEETNKNDPMWEEIFNWLKGKKYNLDIKNLFSIPESLSKDRDYINICDMEGLIFHDNNDNMLLTGVHLFCSKNNDKINQVESKLRNIIQYAQKDEEIKEERIYQEILGIINNLKKSDISSWKHLLKSIIDFKTQSNEWIYKNNKFNRRYFSNGIYSSGRAFKDQELLTLAVDVSGSMVVNKNEIEAAFGVIEELLGKYKIHLVCIDEDVFIPEKIDSNFRRNADFGKPYFYKKGDWKFLKTGNSGTTFFAPLFNSFMKKHHEMLIIITDGYIYDLEKIKKYNPTLWIISETRFEPFYPPFGNYVKIKT